MYKNFTTIHATEAYTVNYSLIIYMHLCTKTNNEMLYE